MIPQERILALEIEGWDALSGTAGADFYRRLLTEDALMVFPFGVLDREQAIAAIAAAPPWARYRIDEPRVLTLDDDSALVIYRITSRRADETADFVAVLSSGYVRRDGEWRLAFHQQSPAPAG